MSQTYNYIKYEINIVNLLNQKHCSSLGATILLNIPLGPRSKIQLSSKLILGAQ